MTPYTETIEVLDPGYLGTGEWVAVTVPKWDLNWVINHKKLFHCTSISPKQQQYTADSVLNWYTYLVF